MKKGTFFFFLLLVSAQYFTPALGQKFEISKVTKEDLLNNTYDEDTTAGAVILFDIGHQIFKPATPGLTSRTYVPSIFRFTRKIRVKILKKSGLDWGNWTFNTPSKSDFKVEIYNLVDGKVDAERAGAKSTYTEQVITGVNIYKVFAPNVKVGSIIDITYSFDGMPYEWRFQERIPIVYNELVAESVGSFKRTFFGFERIETISPTEWHATNMPAFIVEPFLNNYANYLTKFEFGLGAGQEKFREWRAVNNSLMQYQYFGGVMRMSPFLNDFAKDIKGAGLSTRQKIDTAFAYVKSNIKWNRINTILASQETRKNFLTDHSGSSADINLVLVSLLNKMDITTHPVVLSTRKNGLLVQHSSSPQKLNFVVAFVQHDNLEIFLDATGEFNTTGVVSMECLNGSGLLVKEENEQWLELNRSNTKSFIKQYTAIDMGRDGNVKAIITRDYAGYGYLNWMNDFKDNNQDKEVMRNKLQKTIPDLKIMAYDVGKIDLKNAATQEVIELDVSDQMIDTGQEFLLSPVYLFDYSKNPFKSETRKFPVDMAFPQDFTSTVVIQLNGKFSVKQLPDPVKYTLKNGSATFTYQASAAGNSVQLRTTLKLNKAIYTETEYLELRQFFSQVAKKISTPIELLKT